MSQRFLLAASAVAFTLILSATSPAAAGGAYEYKHAAPYPSCPHGFKLNLAASRVFTCTTFVDAHYAYAALKTAKQTGCGYPKFWNSGPEVTIRPLVGKALVWWRCRHR